MGSQKLPLSRGMTSFLLCSLVRQALRQNLAAVSLRQSLQTPAHRALSNEPDIDNSLVSLTRCTGVPCNLWVRDAPIKEREREREIAHTVLEASRRLDRLCTPLRAVPIGDQVQTKEGRKEGRQRERERERERSLEYGKCVPSPAVIGLRCAVVKAVVATKRVGSLGHIAQNYRLKTWVMLFGSGQRMHLLLRLFGSLLQVGPRF